MCTIHVHTYRDQKDLLCLFYVLTHIKHWTWFIKLINLKTLSKYIIGPYHRPFPMRIMPPWPIETEGGADKWTWSVCDGWGGGRGLCVWVYYCPCIDHSIVGHAMRWLEPYVHRLTDWLADWLAPLAHEEVHEQYNNSWHMVGVWRCACVCMCVLVFYLQAIVVCLLGIRVGIG